MSHLFFRQLIYVSMGPSSKAPKTEVSVEQIMAMETGQMMNLIKMSYGCASLEDLTSLVSSFLSEIKPPKKSSDDHMIYTTKEDPEKKKCRIKERLVFFHSVFLEISKPKCNDAYLSAMSDLLALYIDLEVTTCMESLEPENKKRSKRREKEEKEKRTKDLLSRILSSLYVMLDKSEDHILDTILKLKPPFSGDDTKNEIFHSIYALLYRSVAKRGTNRQVRDLTYVRYILIYKLWDNIAKDDDREEVIKQAATRLRPPPGFLIRRRTLPRILPKPPKEVENLTEFFLRERFNMRKSAKKLLEETSQAAHQSTMFPNLSCKPRLLNPRIQESVRVPSPTPNAPLEEITTPQSMIDDLWTRLRAEAPISETSLYDQVTYFKEPRKLSVTKINNILNRHNVQVKKEPRKKSSKKLGPKGAEKVVRSPKIKGEVGRAVRKPNPQTSSIDKDLGNNKRKKVRDIQLPVLKKIKVDFREPDNVQPSYETFKKEPPVISAAVSPFIANVTKSSQSQMLHAQYAMKDKPNMVDVSVSSVEDFDWTMDILKQSLDPKQEQGWQQSCSRYSEKQLMPLNDKSVQSVFGKTYFQVEDQMKDAVQLSCGLAQKKDPLKINMEGSLGMAVDTQFAPDLSGFMWGSLEGSTQYPGPEDPIIDPLLSEWFNECPLDGLKPPKNFISIEPVVENADALAIPIIYSSHP
ncbi:hypothetical protein GE061_004887 [Apolygus lucorum]|uniref:Uncharacterized protein n=1 Tax=Apolygus lucorum TaxID=248454 RepID=A0A8S9WW42_APOLU|nr:hypothetical protein GE061_004887 [Apolygus lucorum]